jgi:hypothetical protein
MPFKKISQTAQAVILFVAGSGLVGCGVVVPDIKEVWDADKPADAQTPRRIPATAQIEFEVKKHVFCELSRAVQYVNVVPVDTGPTPNKLSRFAKGPIPLDWIAQISLSFQVDESSGLTPGVTLNRVLPNAVNVFGPGSSGTVTTAQSRTLGFGGTLSSTATRIDKFNPSYVVSYLMKPLGPGSVCHKENDPFRKLGWEPASSSPFIVEGDLGIQDWLFGAMLTNVLIPSQLGPAGAKAKARAAGGGGAGGGGGGGGGAGGGSGGGPKPDAVSYEVKFVIVSSGNVTPAWKLVNISANTSSTFFSTNRTRTHDLIITIGPDDTRTQFSHLASQIGQSVSGANGALLPKQ